MSKSILFALLTVTGSVLSTADLFAGQGKAGCACGAACAMSACTTTSCSAPASMAPEKAAPADPHAGMNMSQANSGSRYQSFSYEPDAAQPMTSTSARTTVPSYRTYRQPSTSFYDSVRGDRKVRSLSGVN